MATTKFAQTATWLTAPATIAGAIAGLFVPIPLHSSLGEIQFFTIPLVIACAVLYIGAVVLLSASLPKFKFKLRQAYKILIAGMVLIALAQLIIPIGVISNLLKTPWFAIPQAALYPIAMICLYMGTRSFGRLIQVRGWSTSFIMLVITFIPVGALAAVMTHGQFEIVGFALVSWLAFFATGIMWQAKVQAAKLYAPSVGWLALGLAAFSVSLIIYTILQASPDLVSNVIKQLLEDIPPVISGICLLVGAYRFYNIGGNNLAELPLPTTLATSVDIVVYAASLASNPRTIDPLLDNVRAITAQRPVALNDQQQEKLKQTYVALEEYLATQDPLRTYDSAQLRETITKALGHSPKSQTFWPQLSPLQTQQAPA